MEQIIKYLNDNAGLADWLASLGTVAAVFFALWQAGSSSRMERSRNAALMRGLVTIADGAQVTLQKAFADYQNGSPIDLVVKKIQLTRLLEATEAAFKDVSLRDLPHPKAVDGVLQIRVASDTAISAFNDELPLHLPPEHVLERSVMDFGKAVKKLELAWRFYQPLPILVRFGLRKHNRYSNED